jgi:thioredoxin reductase (NADPH)
MANQVENVIIIGGGPAGLAAAVYNARANLNPLVIAGSPPGGQLTLTSEVENFPGFDHILGPELIEKIRSQAKKFGARVIDENVTKVDFKKQPFEVTTPSTTYFGKTVLIATGAKALWLGLESETRLRARGVSACATCDGFFFREKVVAVVGGGDTAMEEALTLTKFASKVYVIHRRDSFRASKIMQQRVLEHAKIEVMWNTAIEEVLGDTKVSGIKLKNLSTEKISTLDLDGIFIAIGHKPDTDLFTDQIVLDEKGYIMTSARMAEEIAKEHVNHMKTHDTSKESKFNFNCAMMTSVPGVFAAGDCVDHVYRQAATAAGMGVAASLEIERWLEMAAE